MEQVAIVGVGQTKHNIKEDQNFEDMVYEAVVKALDDAEMSIKDIDNVVTISNDFLDGRTISSMGIMDAAGAFGKNVTTVEGDGTFGAFYGMARTLSGHYGTTLVVAHSKSSQTNPNIVSNAIFDPIYYRPIGLDAISASALQARNYMDKYGVTEEDCAAVSVKNLANGKLNPHAHLGMNITIDDVMTSEALSDPIKVLDTSPISDGAAALILANKTHALRYSKKPVWVKGVGYCTDAYFLGDRDLAEVPALEKAAKKAYSMAGICNPLKEIDFAEVYDAFSYQELLWLEGLGICSRGKAGELVRNGVTNIDGNFPVNPSGGVLCAHPVLTAGLVRLIEVVLQIRGEAGQYQLDKARVGIAHGVNGLCGQSHCVWILGD